MSEPTKEEMLDWLAEQKIHLLKPVELSGHPLTEWHIEKMDIIAAIVSLIETHGPQDTQTIREPDEITDPRD